MTTAVMVATLIECFIDLTDPRLKRRQRHKLIDIVVIALCAIICAGEGPTDMETFGQAKETWLRQFLELPNGIPAHDTFGRVLGVLNPTEFEACLRRWVAAALALPPGELVPLDGKTLRRSYDKANEKEAITMVSAWACTQRLTLGQVKVDEASNEIPAIPQLLDQLELEGCIVTADALNRQKDIAAAVREREADYVLALKGKHGTLHEAVADYLAAVREGRTHGHLYANQETVDGEHGRIETRRYWQAQAPDWLPGYAEWRDLMSVGLVEARREWREKVSTEVRYYLSSLPVEVARFAYAVRGHWGIENSCHWILDVVFHEDQSRVRVGHAAENLAMLRRLALNLLHRERTLKRGVQGKRLKAALDEQYLLKVLTG
jgi:predicted transposase YbfD/YdcC